MSNALATLPDLATDTEWRADQRQRTIPLSAGAALLAMDAAGLALFWPLALLAVHFSYDSLPSLAVAALYPAAILAASYALGLYRRETNVSLRKGLGRLPFASALGTVGASVAVLLLAPGQHMPASSSLICSLFVGFLSRLGFDVLRRQGLLCRRILVVGAGARAWDLMHVLNKEGRTLGYRLHFLHDPTFGLPDKRLASGIAGPVMKIGPAGIAGMAKHLCPDEIVVAPDERRGMNVQELLECKIAGFPVSQYLTFMEREARKVDIKRYELSWLLFSDGFIMGQLDRALKRVLDVSVSLVVLVLFSPILLTSALVIHLQDGGPALYRQRRITQHGRAFDILKLRTMRVDAESAGVAWAAVADKRITRFGRFLRHTRIDELAQLWNVLRGDMSFVGPRPERPEFVDMLANHLPLYRERHAAKAGLTGWAQINYPYGASIDDSRSKLSYDLYYVKNFSIFLDVLIILQTLRVVLFPSGAR